MRTGAIIVISNKNETFDIALTPVPLRPFDFAPFDCAQGSVHRLDQLGRGGKRRRGSVGSVGSVGE
ncbi:MAG TPA: hypothetical protein IGS52_23450 [Oscillatoriaceae cyanobacterium M33_DOE_052]|uniref:Uncharacterized protein n=1 Tax=Planktothricoides sp. SpSt-374 TaxID=2282167 RepID=A0A7C3VV79_9CYAN|nr:hypothetical protein [Oscillatoriaceae cyanobacterium M33_DOE_052]